MKTAISSVALVALSWNALGGASARGQDVPAVYINDTLQWEEIERPDRASAQVARITIAVLHRDGSLSVFSAFGENSVDGSEIRILYTEGYSLTTGSWAIVDGALQIKHKSIYSTVPRIANQGTWREETWKYEAGESQLPKSIDTGRIRLIPTRSLRDINELLRIINWRKSEAAKD